MYSGNQSQRGELLQWEISLARVCLCVGIPRTHIDSVDRMSLYRSTGAHWLQQKPIAGRARHSMCGETNIRSPPATDRHRRPAPALLSEPPRTTPELRTSKTLQPLPLLPVLGKGGELDGLFELVYGLVTGRRPVGTACAFDCGRTPLYLLGADDLMARSFLILLVPYHHSQSLWLCTITELCPVLYKESKIIVLIEFHSISYHKEYHDYCCFNKSVHCYPCPKFRYRPIVTDILLRLV